MIREFAGQTLHHFEVQYWTPTAASSSTRANRLDAARMAILANQEKIDAMRGHFRKVSGYVLAAEETLALLQPLPPCLAPAMPRLAFASLAAY